MTVSKGGKISAQTPMGLREPYRKEFLDASWDAKPRGQPQRRQCRFPTIVFEDLRTLWSRRDQTQNEETRPKQERGTSVSAPPENCSGASTSPPNRKNLRILRDVQDIGDNLFFLQKRQTPLSSSNIPLKFKMTVVTMGEGHVRKEIGLTIAQSILFSFNMMSGSS